jgi:hypothetical protein
MEPQMEIAPVHPGHPGSLEEFLHLLDIEELDRDLYRGRNPERAGRQVLYGGRS